MLLKSHEHRQRRNNKRHHSIEMKSYLSALMRPLRICKRVMRRFVSAALNPVRKHNQERQLLKTVGEKTTSGPTKAREKIRYRVAVIGAGGMGQCQCLGLQTLPQVKIVGVADQNPRALEELRRQIQLSDARFYPSAEALLKQEKVDLLCVATNTTSHLAVARMAAEAGVQRLIVEKPIGNNVAQARDFARLCADRKVKLAVNQSRRWSNDYAAIKRCVDHGYIGSLRHIYAVPGPGGMAMMGVHYFDLAAYLADSPIAWVIGFLDRCNKPNMRGPQFKDPGGYALLGFQNGVRGFLDNSDDLNVKDKFVVLRGDAGRIEIDERLRQWHLDSSSLGRRTFQFSDTTHEIGYFAKVAAEMLSETSPSCGTAEAIAALEAVIAVHLSSSRDNVRISLPLNGRDAEPEFPFP